MKIKLHHFFILLTLSAGIHQAAAQGTTAFTYQGQLHDGGTNANGAYTMIFKLYDAVTSGNQIGSTITTSPTLANGLFSVNLDFGAAAFKGDARWLEITAQSGTNAAEMLSPRVQVLSSPYAQFASVAATVTNGAIMNAQIANGAVNNQKLAAYAVNATNIASSQVVKNLNGLTDNVILSAGANSALFTNGNTLQMSAGVPNLQLFFSSGTFIVPTNVTRIMVELWGAGGGGGYAGANPGGGGGGGGYALNIFNVTPGSSYTVTTGAGGSGGASAGVSGSAGGTTSFGVLMSAGGGSGGVFGAASAGAGGAGGTSSGSLTAGLTGGSGFPGSENSLGGGVWRGGCVGGNGPGAGGDGGFAGINVAGSSGKLGAASITY